MRRDEEALVTANRLYNGVACDAVFRTTGFARRPSELTGRFTRAQTTTATRRSRSVIGGELIDELRHPDPAFDRGIVFEGELRSPLEPQLSSQVSLEDPMSRGEPGECPLALALGAEHADVHDRTSQVGRGLDAGHGYEPDPRVL